MVYVKSKTARQREARASRVRSVEEYERDVALPRKIAQGLQGSVQARRTALNTAYRENINIKEVCEDFDIDYVKATGTLPVEVANSPEADEIIVPDPTPPPVPIEEPIPEPEPTPTEPSENGEEPIPPAVKASYGILIVICLLVGLAYFLWRR